MKPDEVQKLLDDLSGKKSLLKPIDELPKDTKAKKLPRPAQKELEKHFGIKLSKMRVHSSKDATKTCKDLKVRAFTHGFNIYVFKPADVKNSKLLAHELVHVVQKGGGRIPKPKANKVLVSKKKAKN